MLESWPMVKQAQKLNMPKIIAVVGPTSSGKSDLAVALAHRFNGEVISADSRQVYTGLNIGTGKITKKEMLGIRHHILDVAHPKIRFTVARYQKLANKAIADILKRGKLPILCGGTGFYIQAIVDNVVLPDVDPNLALRKKLEKKSGAQLYAQLKKLDPKRAAMIDQHNHVRIIRAIEIAKTLGTTPPIQTAPRYETLMIGIDTPADILQKRVHNRLLARIKKGMIAEGRKLRAQGLSWKRMHYLGLEYRSLAAYLQNNISKEQFIEQLRFSTWNYVKKQLTWFKRDTRIQWFTLKQQTKINQTIKKFLKPSETTK